MHPHNLKFYVFNGLHDSAGAGSHLVCIHGAGRSLEAASDQRRGPRYHRAIFGVICGEARPRRLRRREHESETYADGKGNFLRTIVFGAAVSGAVSIGHGVISAVLGLDTDGRCAFVTALLPSRVQGRFRTCTEFGAVPELDRRGLDMHCHPKRSEGPAFCASRRQCHGYASLCGIKRALRWEGKSTAGPSLTAWGDRAVYNRPREGLEAAVLMHRRQLVFKKLNPEH